MDIEKKVVWIAAVVQFVNIIDFMMVMPLGPDISKVLPISNGDIGLICGCYTLAIAFSGIACAGFIDRFDRKNVAVIAVAGLSLATLCAAFAWDLYSLIGARILAGFFGGPAAAISLSMVTDVVPPKRRGKAMAIVMGTFSLSSIVAVPFGLELARIGNWQSPFYAITVLGVLVVLLIAKFTPPMTGHLSAKGKSVVSIYALMKNRDNMMALLMMASAMVSSFLIIPNISAFFQFNHGYPRESLGFLYMVGGIFSLVMIQLGGRLSDKIGPIPTNVAGTVVLIVFLFDGFVHDPKTSLLLIFVMFMGTVCIRNISATSEASQLPEPHERAAFMSLLSAIQHGGNGIGALLSSAMLVTTDNGCLVGMDRVAIFAIIMALFQPYILIKVCYSKNRVNKWSLNSPVSG
ncbi:MAG: MFS transporter [Desulfobacteraceae bacterium]|nr:MFS transporter [Desulfobacteraceae bacterium]